MKKVKEYYLTDSEVHFQEYLTNRASHYQEASRNRALSYVSKWNLSIDIGANVGLGAKDLTNFFSLRQYVSSLI